MLRWLMQHMRDAARIGSASLWMACEMQQLTRIQVRFEIQCSLHDAPSPMHAIQMNDARMHSIRYAKLNMP